jgi:hypothetical protein
MLQKGLAYKNELVNFYEIDTYRQFYQKFLGVNSGPYPLKFDCNLMKTNTLA